jgi:hypothetical protein
MRSFAFDGIYLPCLAQCSGVFSLYFWSRHPHFDPHWGSALSLKFQWLGGTTQNLSTTRLRSDLRFGLAQHGIAHLESLLKQSAIRAGCGQRLSKEKVLAFSMPSDETLEAVEEI